MTNWCSLYSQNTLVSFEYTDFWPILGPTIFKIPQPNWYYCSCHSSRRSWLDILEAKAEILQKLFFAFWANGVSRKFAFEISWPLIYLHSISNSCIWIHIIISLYSLIWFLCGCIRNIIFSILWKCTGGHLCCTV